MFTSARVTQILGDEIAAEMFYLPRPSVHFFCHLRAAEDRNIAWGWQMSGTEIIREIRPRDLHASYLLLAGVRTATVCRI